MSEESKIDSDYVHMDRAGGIANVPAGLDDPNLSQEEKDLRLAIALQQQENAQAMAASKAKVEKAEKSELFRTGRSGVNSRLAAVRDKDHGMLSVPSEYNNDNAYVAGNDDYLPPAGGAEASFAGSKQEVADHKLAKELQKVESTDVATLLKKEHDIDEAQEHRVARSGQQAFHPTRK